MNIYGSFPAIRMRRMRRNEFSRRLMRETVLTANDLIFPVFIQEGKNRTDKVASMPGVSIRRFVPPLWPRHIVVPLSAERAVSCFPPRSTFMPPRTDEIAACWSG